MHMLPADIHRTGCYDDIIRKRELRTLGKSSKRIQGCSGFTGQLLQTTASQNPLRNKEAAFAGKTVRLRPYEVLIAEEA